MTTTTPEQADTLPAEAIDLDALAQALRNTSGWLAALDYPGVGTAMATCKRAADALGSLAGRAAVPSEQREAVLAEVAAERRKQVEKHGWSSEHDDTHTDGSLALAAIAYVMPERLYRMVEYAAGPHFVDPWPDSWADGYDRRYGMGERRTNPGNMPPDPATYTVAERRKLLIKGLAMLVAEVERIDRASPAAVPSGPLKDDDGHEWPARLSIRDTKLHDDLGGPGQRIYTTAGRGYKRVEYVRADLASPSPRKADAAAIRALKETR